MPKQYTKTGVSQIGGRRKKQRRDFGGQQQKQPLL